MDGIIQLRQSFFEQFREGHVILFCGRATKDEDLQILANQNFSCILTTRTDNRFAYFFQECGDRSVYDKETLDIHPNTILNKKQDLYIVRLAPQKFQPDPYSMETPSEQRRQLVRDKLQIMTSLVKGSNSVIITGLDPTDECEIALSDLMSVLAKLKVYRGNIQFWEINEQAPGVARMKEIADMLNYAWHCEPLSLVAQDSPDEEDKEEIISDVFYFYDEENEHFYKDGRVYPIPRERLLASSFTLLTQETIHRNQPIGSEAVKDRFLKFLENSSVEGPQWYGYLEDSEYYVRRSFEDPLEEYVLKLLDGKAKHMGPVILHGDPCTSKSVALGNLAYRIFSYQKNPVIFIDSNSALFSENTSEFEDLLELMHYVGNIDNFGSKDPDNYNKNARILLVWDCASYADVDTSAINLAKMLLDKGKRFALVCSAYRNTETDCSDKVEYSKAKGVNRICASRKLSTDEQNRLLGKICEYLDDDSIGASVYDVMQHSDGDIFDIFYTLIDELREPLKDALTTEETGIVEQIHAEQANSARNTHGRERSPTLFEKAYRAAKEKKGETQEKSKVEKAAGGGRRTYDLTRFFDCVALVSRFKMKLPVELGIKLLKADGVSDEEFNRDLYSGTLFRAITHQVPWIHYGLDSNGVDYVFQYRNTREAELRLERKKMTGSKQVELLCKIIEQNYWDIIDSYKLEDLLRYMGPNSVYFKQDVGRSYEHRDILRNLESVIEKLEELHRSNVLEDDCADLASILVTMTREYYGAEWSRNFSRSENPGAFDETHYRKRLQKLAQAKKLAKDRFQDLEEEILNNGYTERLGHKNTMCNTLAVEIANLDYHIREVIKAYRMDFPLTVDEYAQKCVAPEPYHITFRRLSRIIKTDPSNGYPYNTLFSEFINMYEHSNLSEEDKIRYLTDIRSIAFECDLEAIYQSNTDKSNLLIGHLEKISNFASQYKVSIDQVVSGKMSPGFRKIFDGLLAVGNSSGITFVAQHELDAANLARKYKKVADEVTQCLPRDRYLNDAQLQVCQNVIDFMCSDNYYRCVRRNYYAVSLLLRVTWMRYTGVDLFDNTECQVIDMDIGEWMRIRELGELCLSLAGNKRQSIASPVISLVTALAKFQSTRSEIGIQSDLDTIHIKRFRTVQRMRVPFLIYDSKAHKPLKVSGRLHVSDRNHNCRLKLNPDPDYSLPSDIRFIEYGAEFRRGQMQNGKLMNNVYLGLGYTGFAAFTQNWLDSRGDY